MRKSEEGQQDNASNQMEQKYFKSYPQKSPFLVVWPLRGGGGGW